MLSLFGTLLHKNYFLILNSEQFLVKWNGALMVPISLFLVISNSWNLCIISHSFLLGSDLCIFMRCLLGKNKNGPSRPPSIKWSGDLMQALFSSLQKKQKKSRQLWMFSLINAKLHMKEKKLSLPSPKHTNLKLMSKFHFDTYHSPLIIQPLRASNVHFLLWIWQIKIFLHHFNNPWFRSKFWIWTLKSE